MPPLSQRKRIFQTESIGRDASLGPVAQGGAFAALRLFASKPKLLVLGFSRRASASLRYLFPQSAATIARVRRRFFVDQFHGDTAIIAGDTAHHLGRVLRAQTGQLYELSDGRQVRLGRIEMVTRDRVDFVLLEDIPSHQPTLDVTLLLSVVKFEAFEWALEKATELAVSTIVPLAAERSEKALLAAATKRADRWNKILVEASQQSRRVRVPILQAVAQPARAFDGYPDAAVKIMLSERADALPLNQVLPAGSRRTQAILAIGPEGGWTEAEFSAAQAGGFREASLGKLILRTETAVIAALSSINYALSE